MIHVTEFATEPQNSPETPPRFLYGYKLSTMRSLDWCKSSSRIFSWQSEVDVNITCQEQRFSKINSSSSLGNLSGNLCYRCYSHALTLYHLFRPL